VEEPFGRRRWSWDPVLALAPVLLLLLFLLTALRNPIALWSGDQGVKWLEAESLRATGFRSLEIPYPASRIDPQHLLSPAPMLFPFEREDGVQVFKYSAAFALATAWSVELLGPRGFAALPALGLVALCAALWALSRRLLGIRGLEIPLLVTCATPLGIYGVILWEHAPAWALGALALVLVVPVLDSPGQELPWRAFAAGLVLAGAFALRNEALLFGAALGAALPIRERRGRAAMVALSAGLALGLVPIVCLHNWAYHDWIGGQAAVFKEPTAVAPLASLLKRLALAQDLVFSHGEPTGWALALASAVASRVLRRRPWSGGLLAFSAACAAWAAWVSRASVGDGLLATAPWLLLAVAFPAERSAAWRAMTLIGAVTFLVALATVPNSGGAQWGPRYLMFALVPWSMLGLAAGRRLVSGWRTERLAAAAAILLLGLSVLVQQRGFGAAIEADANAGRLLEEVAAQRSSVVATDVWYVPQLLGPVFLDLEVLLLSGPPHLRTFRSVLSGAAIDEFAWLTTRRESKVSLALRRKGFRCEDLEPALPYGLHLARCRLPGSEGEPTARDR